MWARDNQPMKCDNCNTKHYINMKTKLGAICLLSGVPLLPVLTGTSRHIYGVFGNYFILVYILWIALSICITPFFAGYHIKTR